MRLSHYSNRNLHKQVNIVGAATRGKWLMAMGFRYHNEASSKRFIMKSNRLWRRRAWADRYAAKTAQRNSYWLNRCSLILAFILLNFCRWYASPLTCHNSRSHDSCRTKSPISGNYIHSIPTVFFHSLCAITNRASASRCNDFYSRCQTHRIYEYGSVHIYNKCLSNKNY